MAHLWIPDDADWGVMPLGADGYELTTAAVGASNRTRSHAHEAGGAGASSGPIIDRARTADRSAGADRAPQRAGGDPVGPSAATESHRGAAALLLRSTAAPRQPAWMLLACSEDVRINGMAVGTGLSRLRDRDEIHLSGGTRVYFSTEERAQVVPYPRADAIICPRCKMPIAEGTAAVRCPQCAIWYHQSEELPCYSYTPTCATCSRPTDLEAGFQWTPQGL